MYIEPGILQENSDQNLARKQVRKNDLCVSQLNQGTQNCVIKKTWGRDSKDPKGPFSREILFKFPSLNFLCQ